MVPYCDTEPRLTDGWSLGRVAPAPALLRASDPGAQLPALRGFPCSTVPKSSFGRRDSNEASELGTSLERVDGLVPAICPLLIGPGRSSRDSWCRPRCEHERTWCV